MRVAPSGTLAEHSATCLPLAEREHVRVPRRQDPRSSLRTPEADRGGALVRDRAVARRRAQHVRIALPGAAAHALVAAGRRTFRIALRHRDVIIDPEPVLDPLGDVAGHVPRSIRTLPLLAAVHRRDQRDLVHVILAEHRQARRRRLAPPRKELALRPPRRLLPLGFRRQALPRRPAKLVRFGPRGVERSEEHTSELQSLAYLV